MFFYILYGTSLHFHLLIRKVIWNNRMCPYTGPSNKANCFGGGTGAGISVVPVSFLVIHGDNVRIINADPVSNGPIDKAIDLVPELVDKVSGLLEQRKAADADQKASN